MYITKLGHSCVLVEISEQTVLFDPGGWADPSLIDGVEHVDQIVYTHQHPDHFDVEILQSLVERFPDVRVVCNSQIKELIAAAKLDVNVREESDTIRKFTSPHEKLPLPNIPPPAENGYHLGDVFTHPGDSHSFRETKKVLAMPFVSPWGTVTDGVNKALELKPEYVLPVHDWLYNDQSRAWLNTLLEPTLNEQGIKLLSAKPGVRHEI